MAPEGTYTLTGATEPVLCDIGYIAASNGSSFCTGCTTLGSQLTTLEKGSASCDACDGDSYWELRSVRYPSS